MKYLNFDGHTMDIDTVEYCMSYVFGNELMSDRINQIETNYISALASIDSVIEWYKSKGYCHEKRKKVTGQAMEQSLLAFKKKRTESEQDNRQKQYDKLAKTIISIRGRL